mmetsp:Transcript_21663/g.24177  ORF Transcript_21663/g.24177 Transcript_21663/m.24177 type:complete len:225 (-) Transcript_21663:69-743(-)
MKYLDLPNLAYLSSHFNQVMNGDVVVNGKIECYSCKSAGSDKKLYKALETQYQTEIARSPSDFQSTSPFGPLTEKSSRATLIHLVQTLNQSYPNYDFSEVKPDQYKKMTVYEARTHINSTLQGALPDYSELQGKLWKGINQEIDLEHTTVFSVETGDPDSDPFAEANTHTLWSFNYIFCNEKKLKRILLFTCKAQRRIENDSDEEMETNSDYGYYDQVYDDMDI